ncbi:MAG: hypothetical protein EOO38_11935 [Cytophagaceae bacterium]|nr:MAG: hypothetical protein EOO38_11935 [Cytophagaceae bacterium]
MSEQYDPQASYDLMYAEDGKVGEVRLGRYFESGWEVGLIEGDVFHYNGQPAGKVEGLIVTRDDNNGLLTRFRLVPRQI